MIITKMIYIFNTEQQKVELHRALKQEDRGYRMEDHKQASKGFIHFVFVQKRIGVL